VIATVPCVFYVLSSSNKVVLSFHMRENLLTDFLKTKHHFYVIISLSFGKVHKMIQPLCCTAYSQKRERCIVTYAEQ